MSESRTAFLILHGWQNERPPEHWQHRTALALRERGTLVEYPQLPSPHSPRVDAWSASILDALGRLHDSGRVDDVVVIAHSLSTLLWLGARPHSPLDVSRVLLVAPPSRHVVAGFDEIAAFAALPLTLSPHDVGHTTLIASDDDPFAPDGAKAEFGVPLEIPTTILSGQGHFTVDSGYGEWPSLLEWCVDPSTSIRSGAPPTATETGIVGMPSER
ncbi:alpha/beta hydrolase [Agreia pratensis]|uniref:RBBP9/YdeN family alpha/beta hydrolase n=1 Tax=Agreia pratensis TaxID=150121 RepID=UPI00188CDDD8|nr:alpha/beta hydrolase [Agreia pratensis]MBF4635675.1 alpha/beta hydrolase [Agreia pratensis]